jgi:hypothetical protein
MWKVGVDISNLLLHVGGEGPSTSLHKWAQGLGPTLDLETYGKKVIVEIE